MFARVTVIQVAPDSIEQGVEAFKGMVIPAAKGVDGYKGALLLADRDSGKSIGMTLWGSEDARRKGAEAVTEARRATLEALGAGAPEPEEYEVVVSDL